MNLTRERNRIIKKHIEKEWDKQIRDKFVSGLNIEINKWMKGDMKTFDEARNSAAIAEKNWLREKKENQKDRPQKPQKTETGKKTLKNPNLKCDFCDKAGHTKEFCRLFLKTQTGEAKAEAGTSTKSNDNKCESCKKPGHTTDTCRFKKYENKCFRCGKEGHIGKDCPNNLKE